MGQRQQAAVAIVGRGLVSSLGHDVVTACAAARAGLTRPAEFPLFPVSSENSAEGESLTVHSVAWLTRGFEGRIRLARLIEGALRDLKLQHPDEPWATAKTGVFLSLPDPNRLHTGSALLGDEVAKKKSEADARAHKVQRPRLVGQAILCAALDLAQWTTPYELFTCTDSGTTGTAELIAHATQALLTQKIELALIIAAESFLETSTLAWLDQTARLKTPMRPAGLQPGEACGCLLLESARRARFRKASILATIETPQMTHEADCLLEGRVATGRAFAKLVAAQATTACWSAEMRPWLISDQDGEVHRAMEWGNAWLHLSALCPPCRELTMWTPAESFGATGAASGAIAICVAVAAFARGYAPWPSVVIISASDGPVRAVMTLHLPNPT